MEWKNKYKVPDHVIEYLVKDRGLSVGEVATVAMMPFFEDLYGCPDSIASACVQEKYSEEMIMSMAGLAVDRYLRREKGIITGAGEQYC